MLLPIRTRKRKRKKETRKNRMSFDFNRPFLRAAFLPDFLLLSMRVAFFVMFLDLFAAGEFRNADADLIQEHQGNGHENLA